MGLPSLYNSISIRLIHIKDLLFIIEKLLKVFYFSCQVNDPLHLLLINITLDMLGAIIFLKRIHYLTNYHNFMGISHNFTSSLLSYRNYQNNNKNLYTRKLKYQIFNYKITSVDSQQAHTNSKGYFFY